jgi:hypothetical protein
MTRLPLVRPQGKFTFRLLAITLFGAVDHPVVLRCPRRPRQRDRRRAPKEGERLLWIGLRPGPARPRRIGPHAPPFGITLGWIVQALTWASAVVVTAMVGVALVFTALWVLLLVQGMKVDRIVAEREQSGAGEPAPDAAGPTRVGGDHRTLPRPCQARRLRPRPHR